MARSVSKSDLLQVIEETAPTVEEEYRNTLLNDKTRTPLADLSATVVNLLVHRYHVRTKEPVLAALLGLSDRLKSNPVYNAGKMSQSARAAVDDVQGSRKLILQMRVTDFHEEWQIFAAVKEMSGPGRVALLAWSVLIATKLTAKRPADLKIPNP